MAIKYRAAQLDPDPEQNRYLPLQRSEILPLTSIIPGDPAMQSDISNPSAPIIASNSFESQPSATPTASSGLLTETAPLSTTTPHPTLTSVITPSPTTISITNSATPTHTPAASNGMSPGKLIAAIVIPIGLLAILVPVITLWFLNYRRKRQEQRYTSYRNSNSREPMIQKQPSYRGSAPDRPQRTLSQREFPENGIQEPQSARTRNSIGLFNFDLSPNTGSPSTSPPGSQDHLASPRFSFSIARALEMRRSQPSIVQPHARTSDMRVNRADSGRPQTRGSNRNSRISSFDPPPPYASPRPSEAAGARSHFAPLSRIGTRYLTNRSPPQTATQVNEAIENSRSTYASSDVIESPNAYGHVHTRSTSPSLEWPSPPRAQGVVARKPVASQAAHIHSQETSPQNASHLNGPFSSYLPDRISDVSGFSIDTSQWEDPPRVGSIASEVGSAVESNEDSSTIHPHNMI